MDFLQKMYSLAGQTAMITGCSRGIGAALAEGLAAAGARVILAVRNPDSLTALETRLDALGACYQVVTLDVASTDSIDQCFAALESLGIRLDILVNNAGTEQVTESLAMQESIWDRIMDTNLKGAFFCARAAALQMKQKGGAIVNLCSLTCAVGVPGAVPYGASKSGLLGMTRALAAEWASYGIRVNAIGPGYFRTDLTSVFYEDEEWATSMQQKIPLGRFGEMDDLTGVVLFLASQASRYITGQIVYADGGYLAAI